MAMDEASVKAPDGAQGRLRKIGVEASKTIEDKLRNGFIDRYLSGSNILDIGYRGYVDDVEPVVPQAIGVDLDYPGYDGRTLPFPDQSQDAIFASHCLEHISDFRNALRDWFRVVKIGGYIVIAVPHQFLYEKRTAPPSRWNEDHKRFYTPASLAAEIEQSLKPNTYRVRHLIDNDYGFDYSITPDQHAGGCYEIELVIERIAEPTWELENPSLPPMEPKAPGFITSWAMGSEPRSDVPVNAYLRSLPGLVPLGGPPAPPACKMCGGTTEHFTNIDFNKSCESRFLFEKSNVLVEYFRCRKCEFLFTDFCDKWTSRDFSELIYNDDYIKVDAEFIEIRPRRSAEAMAPLIAGAQKALILDYGSGTGGFAAELAKLGFERVSSYDKFTSPERPSGRFDVITSFDVIEHSATPVETLHDMLGLLAEGGVMLIGQTLQPADIEEIRGDWWYLAPRNGHISTYSDETLRQFAGAEGLDYHNFGALISLSRPVRSELSDAIIARCGPRELRREIYAPPEMPGELFGWHPLERDKGGFSFRWTNRSIIHFGDRTFDWGECRVVIPYHIAIDASMLQHSRLRIGDQERPLRDHNKTLFADFRFEGTITAPVSLRTPTTIPAALKGSPEDKRYLGIAIISSFGEPPEARGES